MKTLLYSLIGIALISSIALTGFSYLKNDDDSLQDGNTPSTYTPSPYITFHDDSLIDNLVISLVGNSSDEQLKMISSFIFEQRKFFNAKQIIKVLLALNPTSVRQTAIILMKPYIAPLSTTDALLVFQEIDAGDGISSGIVVSQIYDLNGSMENQGNLYSYMIGASSEFNKNQLITPYSTRTFTKGFQLTSEGKHVGLIIDQSQPMSTVVQTGTSGLNVTRYSLLVDFFLNQKFDIFQNFSAFSSVFIDGQFNGFSNSQALSSYQNFKGLSDAIQNSRAGTEPNDLYFRLQTLLSQPLDQLSDIYILSDGIVTSGTKNVNDFINLVNNANSQRKNHFRINSISFLVGGNEDATVKNDATILLQTLADITQGVFIQVNPQLN